MKSQNFDKLFANAEPLGVGASKLRTVLTLLAATLLPLIIYALISSGVAYRDDRRAIEAATLARAVRISDAIDARLDGVSAMVRALATAQSVDERNWTAARQRAHEIAELDPAWQNISLVDPSNGRVLFTAWDDQALPDDLVQKRLLSASSTLPQFSSIVTNRDSNPQLFAFARVSVDGSPGYLLLVTIDPGLVQQILLASAPRDGVSGVVDRQGLFIARTQAIASRIGKPATRYVRDAIHGGRTGIYKGVTYEGLENYTAYYTSRKTGWSTHVAVSSTLIDGPRYGWRMAAGLAGLLGLLLAIGLVWIILRVVSARRDAEERLRRSERLEAVGKLTGGIAHDFNNMLAIIVGSLDLAHRRLSRGETDVVRYIDNAMDGANRAADLTRRLLAFSRRQPLAPAIVDVNALILATGELLRRTLESNVEIAFNLEPNQWLTFVDPGQLENALVNLAVNARDAMTMGGELTIRTENRERSADQRDDMVAISVSDTGSGMAADVAERAFEPFFTTKEVGRGTGLGLSQIHGFATQSGGDVFIESQLNNGTTVTMLLPRYAGDTATSGAKVEDQAAPAGKVDEILLVVEDEEQVRQTHVEALRSLGYTVRHAANAEEALRILETQPGVRLMLSDIVMPGMNGRDLAQRVKRTHPDVRIILATGYEREIIDSNEHPILRKPFGIGELARQVRRELDLAA